MAEVVTMHIKHANINPDGTLGEVTLTNSEAVITLTINQAVAFAHEVHRRLYAYEQQIMPPCTWTPPEVRNG